MDIKERFFAVTQQLAYCKLKRDILNAMEYRRDYSVSTLRFHYACRLYRPGQPGITEPGEYVSTLYLHKDNSITDACGLENFFASTNEADSAYIKSSRLNNTMIASLSKIIQDLAPQVENLIQGTLAEPVAVDSLTAQEAIRLCEVTPDAAMVGHVQAMADENRNSRPF